VLSNSSNNIIRKKKWQLKNLESNIILERMTIATAIIVVEEVRKIHGEKV